MHNKIAVTGATGFIGSKLAIRHLEQGDEVRVLSRRMSGQAGNLEGARYFQGDLTGNADLRDFVEDVDVLYHCAGEIRDTSRMAALHVTGTQRLIDAASGQVGRWVQLSSTGTYGQRRDGVVTESSTLQPRGVYEETKLRSDELVQNCAARGAFQHVILRPSIVYGAAMPNQSLNGLITMIRRGWFFYIGKPGASANYIHVNNVVHAMSLCALSPQASGQIYNLSDYRTLETFVACIAKAMSSDVPKLRLPEAPVRMLAALLRNVPGVPLTSSRVEALTTRASYAIDKIQRELGYQHVVTMESGLQEMVEAHATQGKA